MTKRLWVLGVLLGTFGCGGGGGSGVPESVDSGFDLTTDAFAFQNFTAEQGALFSLTSAVRMFGAEAVCQGSASPCVPRPLAEAWVNTANRSVAEGRSEGFAVLSQLFFTGELDPMDFGAASVGELELAGNLSLQSELAYWAVTQGLPGVPDGDRKFAASEVMPFLAEALAPSAEERYRLAIAIPTGDGFEHGHALTPIGYFRTGGKGAYYLRVYDSNFPQREQLLEIDPAANTWRYESRVDDGETLVYEGNADNGNLLYFSPVRGRLGQFEAPFAASSDTASVVSQAGVQALATWGDAEVGVRDGALVETGGTVRPVFAACPNCANKGLLNYRMQGSGDFNLRISRGVGRATAMEESGATVNVVGSGFTAAVSGIKGDDQFQDELTVGQDGSLSYRSMSDNGAQLSLSSDRNGKQTSVSVKVNGASEEVRVGFDTMGRPTIDTKGIPEGEKITVVVSTKDAQGMEIRTEVTLTITGMETQVIVDPETGARSVVVDGGTSAHCLNGMFDPGLELGLDCRDTCEALCGAGQPCNTQDDCIAGTRCYPVEPGTPPVCQAPGCTDGLENVDETDIDCGGPMCSSCKGSNTAPQKCLQNSDCDSDICADNLCRVTNGLTLQVEDAQGVELSFSTTFDGVTTQRTITPASHIQSIALGNAYAYDVSLVNPPAGCGFVTTNFFSAPTGVTGGMKPFEKYLLVKCEPVQPLRLEVNGLPVGGQVGISTTVDLVGGSRTFDQDGFFSMGSYRTSWALSLTSQPGNVGGTDYECAFAAGFSRGTVSNGGLDVTGSGEYARYPVLRCAAAGPKMLTLQTSGLPAGGSVSVNTVLDGGSNVTTAVSANGDTDLGSFMSSWNLEVATQPGNVGGTIYTCKFPGDSLTASGDRGTTVAALTCASAGPGACTMDSDCAGSSNCYCGKDSGNCSSGGTCGAARSVIEAATTDGVTSSGSFTVPASCAQVQVQAWGAAGGDGISRDLGTVTNPGGAGGYVRGVWDVMEGDVITVWIGQGGYPEGDTIEFGTPSIGSYLGTRVNGGSGDTDGFSFFGGGGGGLTSVRLTGSATESFSVPAGGGGTGSQPGNEVGGSTTGGASDMNGLNADFGSGGGGGGAGDPGGTGGVFTDEPGAAGQYSMALPTGFVSENGVGPEPANLSVTDHGLCSGGGDGFVNAGGSTGMGFRGGDGCVVIRCVAP